MNISRTIVLLVMMLGASFASIALTPTKRLSDSTQRIDLESVIPLAFADWKHDPSVTPIKPTPEQKETIDQIYDQIVTRTYIDSQGRRVMLSVAYGSAQTRSMRAHRQEVCYAAQGFQINQLQDSILNISGVQVPVTRMVAVQGGRIEPVTYWFTMGDSLVRSYVDRQIAQLKYAFSGFIPDGYLFRVSTIGLDVDDAYVSQLEFSSQFMNAVTPELRKKLLGGVQK
jgi:EpsI family protein